MTDRPPERLLQTPSWLITQIAVDAGRRSREVFDAVGAGRYHYAILSAVEEFGPCSQAELGRRLNMDRKDVAQRVGELEEQQHLQRRPDPADPRRKLVRLSAPGEKRLAEIQAALTQAQDELVAPLNAAERATFLAALQKVLGR
ncbi:MarR family transcriptional regulator [Enemella evansiae]|uniref:MarR family transcriptional regulator n=1 Tax=Enemella evansiae TaxID=2016499 RepID=A0A255GBZ3_9ACTN|nr:MarR family transcriptional regulator [Enemella evansiae]OYN95522.1 MarR family transcriptional regulator [Enemella evansiae]OYO10053.1 MarR family transcriptional regulator [Enemella evansiae]OYO13399.1 MarR family transcriptional regulator [Enemella evansiae]